MIEKQYPLVSAVMPTANRAKYVPGAIRCFLSQTYPNCELVILDDGAEPIVRLVPDDPRIHWYRWNGSVGRKKTLGEKRNDLCELSGGVIIVHWDDDDWYAPSRIKDQVERLIASGKRVTGFHRFFYWDEAGRKAYEYRYQGSGNYVSGSTQCYFRAWWRDNRFKHINTSEDSQFSFAAEKAGELISVPAGPLMVARAHGANTWKQPLGGSSFPAVATRSLPKEFLAEIGDYA